MILSGKTSAWGKHTESCPEKVPDAEVYKEGHADSSRLISF